MKDSEFKDKLIRKKIINKLAKNNTDETLNMDVLTLYKTNKINHHDKEEIEFYKSSYYNYPDVDFSIDLGKFNYVKNFIDDVIISKKSCNIETNELKELERTFLIENVKPIPIVIKHNPKVCKNGITKVILALPFMFTIKD